MYISGFDLGFRRKVYLTFKVYGCNRGGGGSSSPSINQKQGKM